MINKIELMKKYISLTNKIEKQNLSIEECNKISVKLQEINDKLGFIYYNETFSEDDY